MLYCNIQKCLWCMIRMFRSYGLCDVCGLPTIYDRSTHVSHMWLVFISVRYMAYTTYVKSMCCM